MGNEKINYPYDPTLHQYNCSTCTTKCSGKSKFIYLFKDDVKFAEKTEKIITKYILSKPNVKSCFKTDKKTPYPDLTVIFVDPNVTTDVSSYAEVKSQCRTFMSSYQHIKDHNDVMLYPSETVAMNTSDLKQYIKQYDNEKLDIIVFWMIFNRPCVCGENKYKVFKQHIKKLKKIFELDVLKNREYKRNKGYGDINENGEHKGVLLNYHFRLSELIEDKQFGSRKIPKDIVKLNRMTTS